MLGATASALRAAARASPPSGVGSATTPATSSGSAVARPLTAPVAPAAMARGMSGSEPTKTSRPSPRYGSTSSKERSDTFIPLSEGCASRSRSTTAGGTT